MKVILSNIRYWAAVLLCGAAFITWYAVFYFDARQNLLVTFFDVGQGDAIFIEKGRSQILIDGGPGTSVLSKVGQTLPFWDRSIDLLILTHPHADHLDGLLETLKRYEVAMVMDSGAPHSIPEYAEWRKIIQEKNIPVVRPQAGQKISIGSSVSIDILAPRNDFSGMSLKHVHDAMVVMRLSHGENSLLLMGDAERSLEYQLVDVSSAKIDSDILKVGHHGSKTSSTEKFLAAVSPEIAVIQSGKKNRYGHPAQEVLDRLAATGARILRNDISGDIVLRSNGRTLEILGN